MLNIRWYQVHGQNHGGSVEKRCQRGRHNGHPARIITNSIHGSVRKTALWDIKIMAQTRREKKEIESQKFVQDGNRGIYHGEHVAIRAVGSPHAYRAASMLLVN